MTSIECNYMQTLNYQIFFFEIYQYKSAKAILKPFFDVMAYHKIRFSEKPPIENSEEWLSLLNKNMGFTGTRLQLTERDFIEDKEQSTLFKSMLNSAIGKFAAVGKTVTKYVKTKKELEDIQEKETITDFGWAGEIAWAQISQKEKKINYRGNIVVNAFVTARCRIFMHQMIKLLEEKKFIPAYVDTDAIFFYGPKGCVPPIPISPAIGHFSPVLKNANIVNFCSIGRKRYSVTYKNNQNELEHVVKVSGLQHSSKIVSNIVTQEIFETMLKSLKKTAEFSISVPQSRKRKIGKVPQKILSNYSFGNKTAISCSSFQRILNINEEKNEILTVPWGFIRQNE